MTAAPGRPARLLDRLAPLLPPRQNSGRAGTRGVTAPAEGAGRPGRLSHRPAATTLAGSPAGGPGFAALVQAGEQTDARNEPRCDAAASFAVVLKHRPAGAGDPVAAGGSVDCSPPAP